MYVNFWKASSLVPAPLPQNTKRINILKKKPKQPDNDNETAEQAWAI